MSSLWISFLIPGLALGAQTSAATHQLSILEVLDPDGDPAPNCHVVLSTKSARRGEKNISHNEVNCDREGNFRFEG